MNKPITSFRSNKAFFMSIAKTGCNINQKKLYQPVFMVIE